MTVIVADLDYDKLDSGVKQNYTGIPYSMHEAKMIIERGEVAESLALELIAFLIRRVERLEKTITP